MMTVLGRILFLHSKTWLKLFESRLGHVVIQVAGLVAARRCHQDRLLAGRAQVTLRENAHHISIGFTVFVQRFSVVFLAV